MKKIHLKRSVSLALLFIIIAASFGGVAIEKTQILKENLNHSYRPVVQTSNLKVISILFSEPSQLEKLVDNGFELVEINEREALVYISENDIQWLDENGYQYTVIYENIAEMPKQKEKPGELLQFHGYDSMTSELQDIAATYPDIAVLYELGQSVLGRTIWGLKITSNPLVEENEPEVRICGAHHGDEYMSVELPLLLAWHMVQNYGVDPYITDLVDNRETWIIPMVNPDGREAGTRRNANNVDLNRDYGYLWQGQGSSPSPFSQPETQVIRAHALVNNFVISLSYHTTAAYINYVWNYKPQPTPDEPLIIQWADEYAALAPGLIPINGYDWYQVYGDTNDFSYGCRGDIDTTIETANSDIPAVWNQNREAMLMTVDWAGKGLHGVVTDVVTGDPIYGTVWIEELYWPIFTDPYIGDYHKPLLPGTYNVHFTANGYTKQIHTVEIVDLDTPVYLDVALQPDGGKYAFEVTSCTFEGPSNYANNPTDGIHALGEPDEYFASLGVGGNIILDMGESGEIIDGPGDDFFVYEGDDGITEGYSVYVAQAWKGPWHSFGSASGTMSFDLATVSLPEAQFVKIIDDGDGNPSAYYPGFDLDAIESGSFQYDDDVGATEIISPETPTYGGSTTVEATIENFGLNNQYDVPVSCNIYPGGEVIYFTDLEIDNGGFTAGGTSTWQWGTPTSGPGSAHSGSKCWGTTLGGEYPD